jgi:hypothetical protein
MKTYSNALSAPASSAPTDPNKENIRYWNNIEVFLPQQDEFKNSGLEITVGTESDWENNHFKFGWNEIPF